MKSFCSGPKCKEVKEVARLKSFYGDRFNLIQEYQKKMPEPYRTVICNILANGSMK